MGLIGPDSLDEAVDALVRGMVVGIPTDTVYGLAVDPFRPGAADRVFAAKRRPREFDLPVLVSDDTQVLELAVAVPASASLLMQRFWPGALTLVIPRRPGLAADLGEDDATIGVRCPDHPVPLELCRAVGPLGTTSANRHGEPTFSTAEEVVAEFGDEVALVVAGGVCAGAPSTVVDVTGEQPKLLREGRIPWADVLAAVG